MRTVVCFGQVDPIWSARCFKLLCSYCCLLMQKLYISSDELDRRWFQHRAQSTKKVLSLAVRVCCSNSTWSQPFRADDEANTIIRCYSIHDGTFLLHSTSGKTEASSRLSFCISSAVLLGGRSRLGLSRFPFFFSSYFSRPLACCHPVLG